MPNTLRVVRPQTETLIAYDSGNLIAQQHLCEKMKPFLSLKLIGANTTHDQHRNDLVYSSGQAIITYVLSGQAAYADSTGKRGLLKQGGLSWVLSGAGVWSHMEPATENYLAIELCVALAPALEHSPPQSAWLDAAWVEREGPAALLIGWFGDNKGAFTLPSLMNYAVVNLQARQEWHYTLPANHSVVWVLVVNGSLITEAGEVAANHIVLLEPESRNIRLQATTDSIVVVGSSQTFDHDLMSQENSVHTSSDALRLGRARLSELAASLDVKK
jgi:redox-sensitive bicupin YhaK (pirin superfamily)